MLLMIQPLVKRYDLSRYLIRPLSNTVVDQRPVVTNGPQLPHLHGTLRGPALHHQPTRLRPQGQGVYSQVRHLQGRLAVTTPPPPLHQYYVSSLHRDRHAPPPSPAPSHTDTRFYLFVFTLNSLYTCIYIYVCIRRVIYLLY